MNGVHWRPRRSQKILCSFRDDGRLDRRESLVLGTALGLEMSRVIIMYRPLIFGAIRLCDLDSPDVACPVSAAGNDQRGRFGIGCKRSKRHASRTLYTVAGMAQADKVLFLHLAAFGLGDDMPAGIGIPCATSDTARELSHDVGADSGGDIGFFGHSDSP